MNVVSWGVVLPVGWDRGWGVVVPLVYECCKMVGVCPCGLRVGVGIGKSISVRVVSGWVVLPVGRGVGVPLLVYECCKLVGGTSCGLGVGGPFISV